MSAKLVKRVGRLISELQRRYLLISSVTLKIISQSYAIGDLPCLSSVSSLPYPVPVAFMRSHSFALPMSPSFSHSISPGAYVPLLCNNIHTCMHKHTHTHTQEKRPFFCCQNRKFGNAGARLIRAGSHETARADSPFLLARPHLSVSGEIERRAEDISRGFDPRSTKVGHPRRRRREDFSI